MVNDQRLRDWCFDYSTRQRFVANVSAAGGAVRLDVEDGEWYKRIDTKALHEKPVLVQLYGGHKEGVARLRLIDDEDEDVELGFITSDRTHVAMLEAAWKHEIGRRLTK
ncbi:MAG TPA: hypothetical protein VG984_01140 [Candidatus Paceibacterota bacterium]|nr:hypothetical protein [Candidatus Paceibacterota bacterium]